MKKMAIATALCALSAAAAAQSSVNIYGRVDTGVVIQTNRAPGGDTLKSLSPSVWNPSQWGVRGQEDLGGGYRALFDFGNTILVDIGAAPSSVKYFDRNSFVGIAHADYGTLTLGRQINTLADTIYIVDPLNARNSATNMNVRFGYLSGPGPVITNNFGPNPGTVGASLDRVDNAVKYSYKSMATGLSVIGMVAAGEGSGGAAGALLGYDSGPLSLRGSWMRYEDAIGTPFNAYATGIAYRLSDLTIKASYIRNEIDSSLSTAERPYGNLTMQVGAVGVTWIALPQLDINVAAYFGRRTQDGRPDQRVEKYYLAPEYKLSKRTSVVGVALWERFNETGSLLDTGTPLALGTRSSNYLGVAISHAF